MIVKLQNFIQFFHTPANQASTCPSPSTPPITQVALAQIAQTQLAQAQLTRASLGNSTTFFQAMEIEIKKYLKPSSDYRPLKFDRPGFCKPGFETFNKFIQLNKQNYELGKQFINKLGNFEKLCFASVSAQKGCAALLKLARHCGTDLDQRIRIVVHFEKLLHGTLLSLSIHIGDIRAVGALLSSGVNPNRCDFTGTPFFVTATSPYWRRYHTFAIPLRKESHVLEIMQLLIQHGVDMNAKCVPMAHTWFDEYDDIRDCTPLVLMEHNPSDCTALMLVRDRPEKVAELLSLGVDKEIGNFCGDTALMLLVKDVALGSGYASHMRSIEQLLCAGANVFVKNHSHDNLLTIAAAGQSLELVQLLLQSVGGYIKTQSPESKSARYGIMGSFLEARNGSEKTALMVAIEAGRIHIALELVNAGADFEAVFMENHTPKTVRNMIEERNEDRRWDDVLHVIRQKSRR